MTSFGILLLCVEEGKFYWVKDENNNVEFSLLVEVGDGLGEND